MFAVYSCSHIAEHVASTLRARGNYVKVHGCLVEVWPS